MTDGQIESDHLIPPKSHTGRVKNDVVVSHPYNARKSCSVSP